MKPRKFIRLHNAVCPTGQELADTWVFDHPERPDAYDSTIANNAGEANRRRREAKHNDQIAQWDRFDAHETTYKDALEVAYDGAYLAGCKDDVLGLSHLTVADVLDHIESQCLSLTTLEKNQKLGDIRCEWDKNDDIDTFFNKIEKLKDKLTDHYEIE